MAVTRTCRPIVTTAAAALICGSGADAVSPRQITVARDGSGDFRSVQAAVDSLPMMGEPVVIHIKPGIYKERIRLSIAHRHVTFAGDGPGSAEKTVLTDDVSARSIGLDGRPVGTSGSASVDLQADNFVATDLTFENSAGPGKQVGQAVAVKVTGDRCVFRRCRFIGWQDTLYASAAGVPVPLPLPVAASSVGSAPNGAMPGAKRRYAGREPAMPTVLSGLLHHRRCGLYLRVRTGGLQPLHHSQPGAGRHHGSCPDRRKPAGGLCLPLLRSHRRQQCSRWLGNAGPSLASVCAGCLCRLPHGPVYLSKGLG